MKLAFDDHLGWSAGVAKKDYLLAGNPPVVGTNKIDPSPLLRRDFFLNRLKAKGFLFGDFLGHGL